MSASNETQPGLIWYALRTKPGREAAAVEGLRAARFGDVYLPCERRLRRSLTRTRPVSKALIPGLLFVGIGPDSPSIYSACGVAAVQDVIRQACGEAAPIRREADGYHAVYAFQEAEASGAFDYTPRAKSWSKGQRVRITAGCWTGFVGEVLAAKPGQRARVLLSGIFGGRSGVPVDPKHLDAVAA